MRARVGTGAADFDRAVRALHAGVIFPKPLAEPSLQPLSIVVGQIITVRLRAFGIRTVGPCRIVEVIDEAAPIRRKGFVYAALAGHLATGEERFLVELVPDDNAVWYEIVAVSRPRAWWAWIGYPLLRSAQGRFRRQSIEAIRHVINGS